MIRLFCCSMIVALGSYVAISTQEKDAQDKPKEYTNSVGMKFVWIAPGSFVMGSPKEEQDREDYEVQHKVTLTKGFYMGVYTVTQEQWKEIMGNDPSGFTGDKKVPAKNLPVEQVSWEDCQEFIKKLRKKDKKPYRLPTEAEWEYACRAGTTTAYNFGETIAPDKANYAGNSKFGTSGAGVWRQRTSPVDSFPANAWGLHNMHGNVRQWCQDWYGAYPTKDVTDPQGPKTGDRRVLRGGSWAFYPAFCRSASRSKDVPGERKSDFGVRLCFFAE